MAYAIGLLIFQVGQLFHIKGYSEKPKDSISPLFVFLGFFTNILSVVGYGKPYLIGYMAFAAVGFSVAFSWFFPGLWEWCDRFFITLLPTQVN